MHLDDTSPKSACLSRWRKLHLETTQITAKACANYLNAYLVNKEVKERKYDVGFLLNTDGFLTEGPTESIFVVKDGVLKTPPLDGILSSISRKSILEIASFIDIPTEETTLRKDALFLADEIFTSHTGTKVSPINRFENRDLEAPGPVTGKLMKVMDDILHFRDTRFRHFFQQLA